MKHGDEVRAILRAAVLAFIEKANRHEVTFMFANKGDRPAGAKAALEAEMKARNWARRAQKAIRLIDARRRKLKS